MDSKLSADLLLPISEALEENKLQAIYVVAVDREGYVWSMRCLENQEVKYIMADTADHELRTGEKL